MLEAHVSMQQTLTEMGLALYQLRCWWTQYGQTFVSPYAVELLRRTAEVDRRKNVYTKIINPHVLIKNRLKFETKSIDPNNLEQKVNNLWSNSFEFRDILMDMKKAHEIWNAWVFRSTSTLILRSLRTLNMLMEVNFSWINNSNFVC